MIREFIKSKLRFLFEDELGRNSYYGRRNQDYIENIMAIQDLFQECNETFASTKDPAIRQAALYKLRVEINKHMFIRAGQLVADTIVTNKITTKISF